MREGEREREREGRGEGEGEGERQVRRLKGEVRPSGFVFFIFLICCFYYYFGCFFFDVCFLFIVFFKFFDLFDFFHFFEFLCFFDFLIFLIFSFCRNFCKNGKPRKTCECALCTVDDTCCFHTIRLGPKTSECEKYVTVMSTVPGCDVTTVQQHYKGSSSLLASRGCVRFARRPSLH